MANVILDLRADKDILINNDRVNNSEVLNYRNKLDKEVYTRGIIQLENNRLSDSNDNILNSMLEQTNANRKNIKLLLGLQQRINYVLTLPIKRDTVIIINTDTIHTKEYELFTSDYLVFERYVDLRDTTIAHYTYTYSPDLTIILHNSKEGTWRFKNLWQWRKRREQLEVISKDSNCVTTNINAYHIKD
jgi:hypothetical protein